MSQSVILVCNDDGIHAAGLNALEKAKNFIIVDPRVTRLTSRANLWLQVRPGTDAALALGMMNVIINEGLYDKMSTTNDGPINQ